MEAANLNSIDAGTYVVEEAHTHVMFGYPLRGAVQNMGEFKGTSGRLVFDPADPASGRLDVTIPTTGLSTYSSELDKFLKGPEWFDAQQFPIISFQSTGITVVGPRQAIVAGSLALHGVTRSISLMAQLEAIEVDSVKKSVITNFNVSGKIKRSDYGIKTLLPFLSDEIDLIIHAKFIKTMP